MKVALLVVLLAVAVYACPKEDFRAWQNKFGKVYSTDAEWEARFFIYLDNVNNIAALNAEKNGVTYAVNQFADMTKSEIKAKILMNNLPPLAKGPVAPKLNLTIPNSFNWADGSHGNVVTPIYNQGQCGSCWAFSATENIESRWALAGHSLTELSMQQIVDCDTTDSGCNGGWPYNAYQYVIGTGGMDPLADYPYVAENENCRFSASEVVAKISSWQYVTQSQSESQMASYLVSNGPLSVCVDASSWSYYSSGVYMASQCGTSIDHCVDAVGYNLGASTPYWIIRNSWGTSWGQSGFMFLQYNADACAVAQVVTSSVV